MKHSRLTFVMAIAIAAISLVGCAGNNSSKWWNNNHEAGCPCCPPVTQIYIQPLNTYSVKEAEAMGLKLSEITEDVFMPVEAEILPPIQLGDEFKNDAGTRYRASKILDALKKGPKPVIALIHDDVSCTYKGIDDWGVLGLSYLGKDVCVVSTYRVKNKKDFWKVVYHEFGHSHYGLPHCPADDPKCIMQDAKGHPNFDPKKAICDSCWHSRRAMSCSPAAL